MPGGVKDGAETVRVADPGLLGAIETLPGVISAVRPSGEQDMERATLSVSPFRLATVIVEVMEAPAWGTVIVAGPVIEMPGTVTET